MKKILLSLLVLCFAVQLHAQSSEHHWGFAIHPGVYSFYALENGLLNGEEYGGGVQFSLMKSAGPSFDFGLSLDAGVVRHSANEAALIPAQRDNFFSGQLLLRYKFDNGYILDQDFIVSPFIQLGAGANSYIDLSNLALHAPVGAGVQFRIPQSPVRVIAQSAYNVGIQGESFVHHSIGVGINFGSKEKMRNRKAEKGEELSLKPQDIADADYDGVPDEEDRCPYIFGTVKANGCPDSDEDGVKDSEDKCPDDPGFANLLGCRDSDYDGVIDPEDECPNKYGEGLLGCPEGEENDRDGDGVIDDEDACPDVKGFFTAQGCPDKDGDGIKDDEDDCPDHYGTAEHDGCPIPLEELQRLTGLYGGAPEENVAGTAPGFTDTGYKNEEGGIRIGEPDFENPDSPYNNQGGNVAGGGTDPNFPSDPDGQYNNYPTPPQEGDPDYPYPYVNGPAPSMGEDVTLTGFPDPELDDEEYCDRLNLAKFKAAIYFDYDESQIDVVSRRYLGQVVQAMRRCATFELQVAGHTDSDGSQGYNLDLSERRAKAVLNYIQDANVDDKRLKYNGYGEKYPQAPNTSDDNKRLNRRAEIRLIRGPQY